MPNDDRDPEPGAVTYQLRDYAGKVCVPELQPLMVSPADAAFTALIASMEARLTRELVQATCPTGGCALCDLRRA